MPSARRTEQYCGNTGDAADVVAGELPSFHIECKGTQSSLLPQCLQKEWHKQILKDGPPGKIEVIFWKANNVDWVALFTMVNFSTKLCKGVYPPLNEDIFVRVPGVQAVEIMLNYEKELCEQDPINFNGEAHDTRNAIG